MALGIAGDADAEIVAGADEFHQIAGVAEAAFGGDELPWPAAGRIAAKGQDIADSGFPQIVQNAADFSGGMADAGEMRHRQDG